SLTLADVCYSYPGADKPTLDGVSLAIKKGESVALVGPSGAGKTTLVDIVLGLLVPTRGSVRVDDADLTGSRLAQWRRAIGYIPQHVYLCDDSILRNVAFGIEDAGIDRNRVMDALEVAQLTEFVKSLPDGLDTYVGERGARISGG